MTTTNPRVEQLDYTPRGFFPSAISMPVRREGIKEVNLGIRTYLVHIENGLVYDFLAYDPTNNKSNVLPVNDKGLVDLILAHLGAGQPEFRFPL